MEQENLQSEPVVKKRKRITPWHISILMYVPLAILFFVLYFLMISLSHGESNKEFYIYGTYAFISLTALHFLMFSPLWFLRNYKRIWWVFALCICISVLVLFSGLPMRMFFWTWDR